MYLYLLDLLTGIEHHVHVSVYYLDLLTGIEHHVHVSVFT